MLLVLGTAAITFVATSVTMRRDGLQAGSAGPLSEASVRAGVGGDAGTALVASIERLIQSLERALPSRLEAPTVGPPRQAVSSNDDATVVELLREQNDRLAEIHAAVLADGIDGSAPARQASILHATVAGGQRATDLNAWAAFFARHPPDSLDVAPVEIAILSVADLMERFGWPKQVLPPQSTAAHWELEYSDLELPTPDGIVTRIDVYCSRDATYRLDPSLRQ